MTEATRFRNALFTEYLLAQAFSGEADTGSPPGKCDHKKEQSEFCFYEN